MLCATYNPVCVLWTTSFFGTVSAYTRRLCYDGAAQDMTIVIQVVFSFEAQVLHHEALFLDILVFGFGRLFLSS